MRHGWNHTYASDNCKILIAGPEKLKHQHEAGSKKPHRRVGDNYKKKLLLKKDLHALIDERIASNKNKGFTFATLKDAKKYLEKHKNEIESESDSSESNLKNGQSSKADLDTIINQLLSKKKDDRPPKSNIDLAPILIVKSMDKNDKQNTKLYVILELVVL